MKSLWFTTLLIWLCSAQAATTALAADPDSPAGVEFFEKHVRPLLAKRCYGCHSIRADQREGGLLLDSGPGWREGGDSGPAIIPGDVDASLLIQAVRYTDADLQMPPDRALPAEEIARLEQWIQLGAPDPRDSATEGQPAPAVSDPIAGRTHWAFQPLATDAPPPIAQNAWPNSTVDVFVLAELEAANLSPAADAEPRDLLRRVYFQLIGLPPTPEQLHDFLDDPRPDALERVVDRLLESPQFGQRWGRHWLDLARYADSNGLDENFLFREAWRYRNWVIEAVNADLPFDRFVTEQIAGDLLPYETVAERDRQRIAAGFLVVGPKVLLGIDAKQQRMDVADEQLDTVGKAILGQTLGCARCHDHKFDPIPTADYYALAGIFTSTKVMEQRYMLGQQRVMEQLVGLGEEGSALDDAYEHYWRERSNLQAEQKRAKSALELLQKDDEDALAVLVKEHGKSVAEVAADACQAKDKRLEAQTKLVAELDAAVANPPGIPPRAMIPSDGEPANEHIRLAGQFDRLGEQVPRGFLRVMNDGVSGIPDQQSGRLALANWLTDIDSGAGRVAARVLANRLWQHVIGRGIVRTVDNFGRTGEEPSHPALLDYLAVRLIESDWSIKAVIREIVLSRTFAMNSGHDESGHALDPENRLLWRAHRLRLEPEALRDAMLAIADRLDYTAMNSTVDYLGDQATAVGDNSNRRRTDFPCRSIYLPVIRNDLPELFDVFNFADPHATTGLRTQTMVATQGLFLLNDESVMVAGEAIARRLMAEDPSQSAATVQRMYSWILNSAASEQEAADIQTFVETMQQHLTAEGEPDAALCAWSMACHALLASSRFQILE